MISNFFLKLKSPGCPALPFLEKSINSDHYYCSSLVVDAWQHAVTALVSSTSLAFSCRRCVQRGGRLGLLLGSAARPVQTNSEVVATRGDGQLVPLIQRSAGQTRAY